MFPRIKTLLASVFFLLHVLSFAQPSATVIHDLRCENLVRPHAIDSRSLHFSWKIKPHAAAMQQAYYEIQVGTDSVQLLRKDQANLWNSEKIASTQSVMIPYAGTELSSRTLAYWRVRIWNKEGKKSTWSAIQRFGIGLIANDTMQGHYIGLHKVHSPLLRKTFSLDRVSTAFLHINSLGYYEVYINGKKVGDDVLSPAVSHIDKRSLINTLDVTSYLKKGQNEIVFWLGTGWYKKTTGFDVRFDGAIVKAQLDTRQINTWKTALTTDASWKGSPTGYHDTGAWQALQFAGELVDANLNPTDFKKETLDKRSWQAIDIAQIHAHTASPQMSESNKIQQTFVAKSAKKIANKTWLIDMGKGLNGWFEIEFHPLKKDQRINIEYSDYIDKEGKWQDQGQHDVYISSGKSKETFRNKFNHHAFQYVRISNIDTLPSLTKIKAHLIHGGYRNTSTFESSDADINAIHDMIKYTMSTLTFSGYMVDCAHLERAGYGGDGNSSTNALQMMYDVSPVYSNWVQAWADVMREGGSLPHVAPNPGAGGGGPYWCSFLIMSSWRTYVNYNDDRLIKRYYPMMKQWLGYVAQYTKDGLLKRWPDTKYRDWYLGDWLAPHGVDAGNQASVDLVNNCAISECLDMMEKMATLLDNKTDQQTFAQRRKELNALIQQTFYDASQQQYATGSQLDMTYPMLIGITPAAITAQVKEQLFKTTTEKHQDHIAVGLVGVPILTQWAIDNQATDFMYTMLKKRTYPGYLYMIDQGASTTWEYWNGERSRIHNCYNGIGTWFYQALAGIRVDEKQPGYKHFTVAPQIPNGMTWVNASLETPYGEIKVNWKLNDKTFLLNLSIPSGTSSDIHAPTGMAIRKINSQISHEPNQVTLSNGVYQIEMEVL